MDIFLMVFVTIVISIGWMCFFGLWFAYAWRKTYFVQAILLFLTLLPVLLLASVLFSQALMVSGVLSY